MASQEGHRAAIGSPGGVVTVTASAFTTARILGSRTVHQVAGPMTDGLQRTVCGLTRRLTPSPADPVSCSHCLRLTDARVIASG